MIEKLNVYHYGSGLYNEVLSNLFLRTTYSYVFVGPVEIKNNEIKSELKVM